MWLRNWMLENKGRLTKRGSSIAPTEWGKLATCNHNNCNDNCNLLFSTYLSSTIHKPHKKLRA